jgi:hypothetical protein
VVLQHLQTIKGEHWECSKNGEVVLKILRKAGQKHSACVRELYVTVTDMKIYSVEQQCSYGKFMTPATMQITRTSF